MIAGKGRAGKCSNFGNCSLADTRANQDIPAGMDFLCNECGKPLLAVGATEPARSKTAGIAVAIALLVLLLAGGAIAWSFMKGKPTEGPAVEAPAPRQEAVAPAPAPAPAPPAAAPAPLPPESGNCSDADAKAGLCRKKE